MDVKELMAFKPSQTPKRPALGDPKAPDEMMEDDPSDSYEARAKKRKLAMKKAQEVSYIIFFYETVLRRALYFVVCDAFVVFLVYHTATHCSSTIFAVTTFIYLVRPSRLFCTTIHS